jgi:hypothetical protein
VLRILPDAPSSLPATLTIPDIIWNPLVAVLGLNRYFPISEALTVMALGLTIQAAMAGIWLYSWIMGHVVGK